MVEILKKAFGHIEFYDDNHIYIDRNNGNELVSVTTYIKRFQNDFDTEYWAGKKALDTDRDIEEVKADWEEKRIYGAARGTAVHKMAEDISNNRFFTYPVPEEIKAIGKEDDFLIEMKVIKKQLTEFFRKAELAVVKNELITGNYEIAGQIDMLATKNGKNYILDFKTDKEIKTSNKFQSLKAPFEMFPDTNYYKYLLQLNIYRELIEASTEIRIDNMYIIHLNSNADKYKLYEIQKTEVLNTIR